MLTRGQEGSTATYEAYGKAVEILGKNSDPNSALCEVYELVQDLPTTSRIPPVLQCMIKFVFQGNLNSIYFLDFLHQPSMTMLLKQFNVCWFLFLIWTTRKLKKDVQVLTPTMFFISLFWLSNYPALWLNGTTKACWKFLIMRSIIFYFWWMTKKQTDSTIVALHWQFLCDKLVLPTQTERFSILLFVWFSRMRLSLNQMKSTLQICQQRHWEIVPFLLYGRWIRIWWIMWRKEKVRK